MGENQYCSTYTSLPTSPPLVCTAIVLSKGQHRGGRETTLDIQTRGTGKNSCEMPLLADCVANTINRFVNTCIVVADRIKPPQSESAPAVCIDARKSLFTFSCPRSLVRCTYLRIPDSQLFLSSVTMLLRVVVTFAMFLGQLTITRAYIWSWAWSNPAMSQSGQPLTQQSAEDAYHPRNVQRNPSSVSNDTNKFLTERYQVTVRTVIVMYDYNTS